MRYNYQGYWGCDSCCDIEVQRRSDGKHIFVATELPDNPGTSVTNRAEPACHGDAWRPHPRLY